MTYYCDKKLVTVTSSVPFVFKGYTIMNIIKRVLPVKDIHTCILAHANVIEHLTNGNTINLGFDNYNTVNDPAEIKRLDEEESTKKELTEKEPKVRETKPTLDPIIEDKPKEVIPPKVDMDKLPPLPPLPGQEGVPNIEPPIVEPKVEGPVKEEAPKKQTRRRNTTTKKK